MKKQKIRDVVANINIKNLLWKPMLNKTFLRFPLELGNKRKIFVFDHRDDVIEELKSNPLAGLGIINKPARVIIKKKCLGNIVYPYIVLFPSSREKNEYLLSYLVVSGSHQAEIDYFVEDRSIWSDSVEEEDEKSWRLYLISLTSRFNPVEINFMVKGETKVKLRLAEKQYNY